MDWFGWSTEQFWCNLYSRFPFMNLLEPSLIADCFDTDWLLIHTDVAL